MSNPTNITADPGVPFVDTVREFDAPVDAVYHAHVEPELMVQWLGPREDKVENIQYDTRVGGRWSFDGAATTHSIPAAFRSRARPNPVGPAS